MQFKFLFSTLLLAPLSIFGVPISHNEIVQKSANGLRLLSLADGAKPVWKTEAEKFELIRAHVGFFDVTEVYELQEKLGGVTSKASNIQNVTTYPPPSHEAEIEHIISTLRIANLQSTMDTLSAFHNRFYNTSTGVSASNYILDTVKKFIRGRRDITASQFAHRWPQSSVIVRIAGTVAQTPLTIIGGHMDSVNADEPETGRAPGADDDGTGVVVLMEALRVLVDAGFKPRTPVEFQFYAAEEVGLLGSQAIATNYKSAGTAVKAMMQIDMAGYTKPGTEPVIGLMPDYTDKGLNDFLKLLIPQHSDLPVVDNNPCKYGCSDHASWHRLGYPTSLPFEGILGEADNPYIHTPNDTTSVDGFSWDHVMEFTKVAVAYVYEMAI